MKTHKNTLFLIFLIALVLSSCRKNEVININNTKPPVVIPNTPFSTKFFIENIVPSQFFTFNASNYWEIKGKKGTNIYFYPGGLKNPAGNIVTGNVEIELKEIYSKGDMILSGIFPISYGKLLVSGGEIFLKVKQNGVELHITDTNHVKVKMPYDGVDTNTMYVFSSDSLKLYSKTDSTGWGTQGPPVTVIDSFGIKSYGFPYPVGNFQWINTDYLEWGPNPLTMIYANTQDTSFNDLNTLIFISFKGKNIAVRLQDNNLKNFIKGNIPTQSDVTFIAISEKNGQYYSSFSDSKIVLNHKQNMTLTPTTMAQIKAQLALLQ